LPRLSLNCNPSNFYLLGSWDYRHALPHPAQDIRSPGQFLYLVNTTNYGWGVQSRPPNLGQSHVTISMLFPGWRLCFQLTFLYIQCQGLQHLTMNSQLIHTICL
jgi:hypothetical protein